MDQMPNPSDVLKVAVPAVVLAPVCFPILHAVSGVAVIGLGLFAAGTAVVKTISAVSGGLLPKQPRGEAPLS